MDPVIQPLQLEEINTNTEELKSNKENDDDDGGFGDFERTPHLENNSIPQSNAHRNEANAEDDVDDDDGFGDFEAGQNESIPIMEQEPKKEKKLHVPFNF